MSTLVSTIIIGTRGADGHGGCCKSIDAFDDAKLCANGSSV